MDELVMYKNETLLGNILKIHITFGFFGSKRIVVYLPLIPNEIFGQCTYISVAEKSFPHTYYCIIAAGYGK